MKNIFKILFVFAIAVSGCRSSKNVKWKEDYVVTFIDSSSISEDPSHPGTFYRNNDTISVKVDQTSYVSGSNKKVYKIMKH